MRGKRNTCGVLMRKPEGNTLLARARHKREYKIDLKEIGWAGMDWIHLAQDMDKWQALLNTVRIFWSDKMWEIPRVAYEVLD
jgi:hypothetical protein